MPDSDSNKANKANKAHRRALKNIWLLAALVTIFALLIFVGIPAYYFASQPNFYRRYKAFKASHEAWQSSTHSRIDCAVCHTEPGLINTALYKIKAVREFYVKFISNPDKPTNFSKPTKEICFKCHTLNRTVTTSLGLIIPHKTHITNKKIKADCLDCHERLVHEKRSLKRNWNTPPMMTCRTSGCHDGKKAPKECKTCHPPNFELKPKFHLEAGFIKSAVQEVRAIHVKRYKNNEKYCHMCHEQNYCDNCHGTDMPHPDKEKIWVKGEKQHTKTSKERPELCNMCHPVRSFCTDCHHDHDPARGPWYSPKLGESVHPSVVREKGTPYCLEKCHNSTFCADPCHLKPKKS